VRLRRSDCSAPGIRRRRAGRGFYYVDSCGHRVTDTETLERIRALVIPPAWTDVWICDHPRGHIQATGIDARGRKQYRYHDAWRKRRDREKFDHMLEFGRALPALRERVAADLALPDLPRARVLACATRLLDHGLFRIGTEGYAEENQTYGLATIEKRHVRLLPGFRIEFDYDAKSGKHQTQSVVDADVYAVIEALKRRRGGKDELLAWRQGRTWVDVRSADINAYIKEVTGGDYTAKDFRTWGATVFAAMALSVSTGARSSPTARKRAVTRAVKEVAHYLGNTPAVCRSSYIDPRVIDRYAAGETLVAELTRLGYEPRPDEPRAGLLTHGPIEAALLELLDAAPPLRQAA
jgi:DNA topoisomerase IB